MKEIEVKILEINRPQIIAKLKKLGAKKMFDGKIEAFRYDFANKQLKNEKMLLRVRKIGTHAELALKSKMKKGKVKSNIEYEVHVSHFQTLHQILSGLGLKRKPHGTKHRVSYRLGKMHVDIDSYVGIPTYLEIEAQSVKDLKKYVQKLGFKMSQTKSWTVRDVHRFYGKKLP